MGEYKGKISGIGNATTRLNEITADDLAILRYYQIGWGYGVVDREGYNFPVDYEISTSSVRVGKGLMFAYGYVGFVEECELQFIRPTIPQYHIVYVELDRSKLPNTCILKVKNNQSSTSIERAFRQDYLDKVRTGIFQLPLWRVKVGSNGIEEVHNLMDDLQLLKKSIKQVEYADNCKSVFGSIDETVYATTQSIDDVSEKIATTDFVHKATRKYIDGDATQLPDNKVALKKMSGVINEQENTVNTTFLVVEEADRILFNEQRTIMFNGNTGTTSTISENGYITVISSIGSSFSNVTVGFVIIVEVI